MSTGTVHDEILAKARAHGIEIGPSDLDTFAEAISRLADSEVEHNDATRALVAMERAGVLSLEESDRMLDLLMDEMGIP